MIEWDTVFFLFNLGNAAVSDDMGVLSVHGSGNQPLIAFLAAAFGLGCGALWWLIKKGGKQ